MDRKTNGNYTNFVDMDESITYSPTKLTHDVVYLDKPILDTNIENVSISKKTFLFNDKNYLKTKFNKWVLSNKHSNCFGDDGVKKEWKRINDGYREGKLSRFQYDRQINNLYLDTIEDLPVGSHLYVEPARKGNVFYKYGENTRAKFAAEVLSVEKSAKIKMIGFVSACASTIILAVVGLGLQVKMQNSLENILKYI